MPELRATDGLLAVMVLLIAWSVYRAQRSATVVFNLFDIIMDNGKVSRIACVFMGSFGATTWVILRLTLDGKLTEGYLGLYMTAWVAPVVARMFATNTPASVTSTTSTTTVVTPP